MATNNLTVRKGKCINFGNCKIADAKEIVEVNLGDEFICSNPDCLGMLVEVRIEHKRKWLVIGGGIILVMGLITWGVFAYINFQKNKIENVVEIAKAIVGDSSINVVKDTLNERIAKFLQEADLFLTNKDYEKAMQAYKSILALDPNNLHAKQSLEEIEKIKLPPVNGGKGAEKGKGESGSESTVRIAKTLKFDFGIYKGETLKGLRDGQGVMTFTERYLISPKDLKKRYAEAGDYVSGTWVEGNIVNGKLFDKNGEQKEHLLIGH